jgi:ribosome-binding protein aMBF1 (putative translation factor)
MPRPYVSSFEDAPTMTAYVGKAIAEIEAVGCGDSQPGSKAGKVESGPTVRPPLVRQKTRAKPRARTSAEWYVVQAFADCLSRERERRGWGMTALAAHIGMSVSQYRKMENGHLGSTIRLANKVCRRLGITFSLGEWPE